MRPSFSDELLPPRDLGEAVQATRSVLEDEVYRIRLGQAARRQVETWDWEHSIDRVREVYREAVQTYRPTKLGLTLCERLAGFTTNTLVSAFHFLSKDRDLLPKAGMAELEVEAFSLPR